ncbi:MAG TPA: hypothetical protein DCL21_01245 [Alphaproteobacteria bacterium]|nr:hypothetical protein [Alphaproteobacteria bacterium]
MPLEPLAWTGYTATRPLVENNGVVGWDGPYLSYELNPTVNINNKSRYALVHPRYTDILIGNFSNSSWGESIINDCSAPGVCYVWSAFTNVDAETAAAVDLYIDGVADKSNGRIRIHDGDPNFIHVFYKLQPLIKQN